jgi:hypothetical protein
MNGEWVTVLRFNANTLREYSVFGLGNDACKASNNHVSYWYELPFLSLWCIAHKQEDGEKLTSCYTSDIIIIIIIKKNIGCW